MEKKQKSLLALTLAGILLLLFLSRIIEPKEIAISDITKDYLDKKVKISAKITDSLTFDDTDFKLLTMEDSSGKITVTLNTNIIFESDETKYYEVTGKVQTYQEELQINAEKIVLLNP